jgi:hypothetical protein
MATLPNSLVLKLPSHNVSFGQYIVCPNIVRTDSTAPHSKPLYSLSCGIFDGRTRAPKVFTKNWWGNVANRLLVVALAADFVSGIYQRA